MSRGKLTDRVTLKKGFIPLAIIILFFSSTCTKKVPPPTYWPLEPLGVNITYQAATDLNFYDNQSHSIVLCVYQLSTPNGFNTLRKGHDGLIKLMECQRFDDSVISFNQFFVLPEDQDSIVLDRGENVRFCGVVAGYYDAFPTSSSRLINIPLIKVKRGHFKRKVDRPAHISVQLYLGRAEIVQTGLVYSSPGPPPEEPKKAQKLKMPKPPVKMPQAPQLPQPPKLPAPPK